jgi:DNA transposition AAA+ family ATPase
MKKREIRALISPETEKQQVLVVVETETPGVFSFRDKIVSEAEIAELAQGYENIVRMLRYRKKNS